MNIALLANLVTMAPLKRVQRWLAGGRFASGAFKTPPAANASWRPSTGLKSSLVFPVADRHVFSHRVMPLRVVRVAESGLHRSSVGRMVISGRMADVCAELDRLVAREAEQTKGVETAR
jgi:hypothetical protein